MLSTLFGNKICTLHSVLWKRMYTLFSQECQLKISRPSTYQEIFTRRKEEDVELGKIWAPSTVNNTESESTRSLSSALLKRLRHTSIKLKSAKWVFLRDLHRLNCNGFLFLVSPAAIMMWPLLLLLLLLILLFVVFRCCCFFCVLVFSAC